MCNLENKVTNIKNPNHRIYVAMNVLSSHKLFTSLTTLQHIYEILKLIQIDNNKFRMVILIKGIEDKIYIYFPHTTEQLENIYTQYDNNIQIKKIRIEYNLLYDAASDEAKKKYNKTIKEK